LRELDYAALRRLTSQWREMAPNFYGDFYPLTPWSRDETAWIAWQFDRPEAGEGVVQVFRLHRSYYESARLVLAELEPEATYQLTELLSGDTCQATGGMLRTRGLAVAIPEQPGVAVWHYRRQL
jgi:alpha-galactosidase